MRSNWCSACVHLMLALVVAVDVAWLIFAGYFLIPQFLKLAADGVIDLGYLAEQGSSWMPALLNGVYIFGWRYGVWALFAAAGLIGLFEWRMQGQHKTFIRLSALGTLAVAFTMLSVLVGASLAYPQILSGPVTSRMALTFARVQVDRLDDSISRMEQALLKNDWEATKEPADRARQALYNLEKVQPAVRALYSPKSLSVEEMRTKVKEAVGDMTDIRQAIASQDADQMETALAKLRQSHAPLREAAGWAQ
jgi:hypothetical protein